MIKIILPGEPVAKVRPRVCRKFTYDPQDKIKSAARFQILDFMNRGGYQYPYPESYPVEIEMNFFLTPKRGEENLLTWGIDENVSHKDTDNLCKFYLDAMNGIVYADDKQVNSIIAKKFYGNEPRTEITIMAKRPSISEKTKEVLSYISKEEFVEIANKMDEVSANLLFVGQENSENKETDCKEAAIILCEVAEKYAEIFTKIKKKFAGFAKVLKDEKDK